MAAFKKTAHIRIDLFESPRKRNEPKMRKQSEGKRNNRKKKRAKEAKGKEPKRNHYQRDVCVIMLGPLNINSLKILYLFLRATASKYYKMAFNRCTKEYLINRI